MLSWGALGSQRIKFIGLSALGVVLSSFKTSECNREKDKARELLDRRERRDGEFDLYMNKVEKGDLKTLVNEFAKGKNVWPWVWTHRNENGPHFVFVGSNKELDERIKMLAKQSPQNNLLVVATTKDSLSQPLSFYYENRCGVIEDVEVELIDSTEKILMLNDERIICFDELNIV